MNVVETGALLALMAQYDYRNTGRAEVTAWFKVIGDLPYADAEQAVLGHYRDETERIMPAHLRRRVRDMHLARLKETPLPEPPREVADDPAAYQRWLAGERRKIITAPTGPRALGASS